jgi:hypothetical protein
MTVTLRVQDGEVAYETRFSSLVLDQCDLDLLHSAYEEMRKKVEQQTENRHWIKGTGNRYCPFDHYREPCPVHSAR